MAAYTAAYTPRPNTGRASPALSGASTPRALSGYGSPCGLRTLADLKKEVKRDFRRTGASIALSKSMGTWVTKKSATTREGVPENQLAKVEALLSTQRRSSLAEGRRISMTRMHPDNIVGLEDAFNTHKAAFDLDGDGTISVEELIIIFERCHLFNEHFTPDKIRDYFKTWADGCNHYHGREQKIGDDGIGFTEFSAVLHWAADMTRNDFDLCVQKVVRLSKRLCDKEASVQRRLEVVFDSFCKRHPAHMTAFEFGHLCRKLELQLCMGDIFSLFSNLPGGVQGKGVDFKGFIQLLSEVGERLGMGDDVYQTFAKTVELLDTDEETINRVRMRLRHAASVVGGADWKRFFLECDPNGSGSIDWDEFLVLCRTKLHLADRDNHLRLLFERIDIDGSDELSIDELVAFVASDATD